MEDWPSDIHNVGNMIFSGSLSKANKFNRAKTKHAAVFSAF